MKGWLFTGAHEPLQLVEREAPKPGAGQIVLEVRAAGLCHSDVGFMDGTLTAMLRNVPMILGHEVAGVVAQIGAGVSGFKLGDRVVVGGPEEFAPGWSVDGGYATECLIVAAGLIPLPDSVSFVQGATATDAGMTAYGAVMGAGELKAGQRIGIIGLGGLGMTGARIAVINGAAVYAAEPRKQVWETAKKLGVKDVVEDAKDLARHGLDTIVDFAGFGTTTAAAVSAVRAGGLIVQVGLGRAEATISTAELVGKFVTLRGSRGGRPGDIAAVLAHMQRGELQIEASTVGFKDIPEALERLKRGGVVGRLVATDAA
jgi:alcohol dehydrogenase, propanol-preferring